MCGRMHPGETNASWLMHGFIRFILSTSSKAKQLRKIAVFKIIPMLNPDGVILGNYRASLAGCDINRRFGDSHASERLIPESI
jgi:murein tripeptide amidase MpaA